MKPAELEAFQSTHHDHQGKPLTVDGQIGPRTRWALDVATLSTYRQQAIACACSHVGFVEQPVGSNSDPKGFIAMLLKRCGVSPALSWCAAFLSFVINGVKIAGALRLGEAYPYTMNPVAGDIGYFATDSTGKGHCFLVIGVSATEVMTVEGNIDNAVKCLRRPRMHCRFGRTDPNINGTNPSVLAYVELRAVSRAGTR